jgi:hypothetical protein
MNLYYVFVHSTHALVCKVRFQPGDWTCWWWASSCIIRHYHVEGSDERFGYISDLLELRSHIYFVRLISTCILTCTVRNWKGQKALSESETEEKLFIITSSDRVGFFYLTLTVQKLWQRQWQKSGRSRAIHVVRMPTPSKQAHVGSCHCAL